MIDEAIAELAPLFGGDLVQAVEDRVGAVVGCELLAQSQDLVHHGLWGGVGLVCGRVERGCHSSSSALRA
jgi:hypothetical protein